MRPVKPKTLGARVRKARKDARLTQVALAQLIGVRQSAISDLETGESKEMDSATLLGIAKATRVRPEWLKYGEEPMRLDDDASLLVLRKFHNLSPGNRRVALATIEALLRSQTNFVAEAEIAATPAPPMRPAPKH